MRAHVCPCETMCTYVRLCVPMCTHVRLCGTMCACVWMYVPMQMAQIWVMQIYLPGPCGQCIVVGYTELRGI